ncbi:Protein of unknown function [Flavobacterium indicum GPTSA100-9 = DSM 17447]|uniref:YdhG-like domain-containing protein n=1 Tax=Flavobacterium indicum (strain DSM 17447 / CIP 109464 / GPTSA100-9) TaxID=1094466 RepID=H8XQT3_FLAIG|nr:DUF1801 domain-containing protein [Flavobacterium indicum]CCG53381.1 Protein of unknown function [Flavobacterium indicum GPTSA100-9 = DSM 17447]
MTSNAKTPQDYIDQLPEERKEAVNKLRNVILAQLPKGFSEGIGYGMLGYVVPHTIYPSGYHCDPKQPLPFMALASQKNSINFYHMGIYANKDIYDWFVNEFPKHSKKKLDMGKSCIRFKKPEDIPFQLIGELVAKISVEDWIATYEQNLKR